MSFDIEHRGAEIAIHPRDDLNRRGIERTVFDARQRAYLRERQRERAIEALVRDRRRVYNGQAEQPRALRDRVAQIAVALQGVTALHVERPTTTPNRHETAVELSFPQIPRVIANARAFALARLRNPARFTQLAVIPP